MTLEEQSTVEELKVISIGDRVYMISQEDFNNYESYPHWSAKEHEKFLLMVEEKYDPILIVAKQYDY